MQHEIVGVKRDAYVPDLESIISGKLQRFLRDRPGSLVIIHIVVIEHLTREARKGSSRAIAGLKELSELNNLADKGIIEINFSSEGYRYNLDLTPDLVNLYSRQLARGTGAVFVASDQYEFLAAKSLGLRAVNLSGEKSEEPVALKFFDKETMSIHLKEGVPPIAKKGHPGDWRFVELTDTPLERVEIEEYARQLIEAAAADPNSFIEIDREGSTIVQYKDYRTVITRPPLSEGWEITIVRPLVKLSLYDYNLHPKLIERFNAKAEGVLIAGAPGMGKTTFAQALAEYYMSQGKIVKTIESPRDMRLSPRITQYSKSYATVGELHDILLLSRPDYTVFDELRNDEDFKLYVDLRLAGIGMIGVTHATTPIDAVQRFLKRVELGMIPSIIDTVIFIDRGMVGKVYELRMTVKLPSGLREADLSRPVVEVRDYLTGELEYEIYTFGEQTMVVPVRRRRDTSGIEAKITAYISKLMPEADIEFRGSRVFLRIPRTSQKGLPKKIKRIRKMVEKHGYDLNVSLI
ncbi:MAG: Flp pilus assembly complex ATPase component TadA [Desulfurococcales archaeon]|nr:Flp pilus assembly complex ATPase component TadA [Desulfurococcales archaeon]